VPDPIQWLDDWLLDIAEIDKEHRELVDLVNRLLQCRCGDGGDLDRTPVSRHETLILHMLDELGLHTRRHFRHEEAFMRESAYPDFEDHRYEHITMLAEFAELVRDVRKQGVECLDGDTLAQLKCWLISHMAGADRRFGDYHRRFRAGVLVHGQGRFDRYWTRRAGDH